MSKTRREKDAEYVSRAALAAKVCDKRKKSNSLYDIADRIKNGYPGEFDEVGRMQNEIIKLLRKECPECDIDGSGTDSGDPAELTLAEIGQAIGHLKERDVMIPSDEDIAKALLADFPAWSGQSDSDIGFNITNTKALFKRCVGKAGTEQTPGDESARIVRNVWNHVSDEHNQWSALSQEEKDELLKIGMGGEES